MKENVEEDVEASEEDDLLESYDKELAMYDLGNHKGFLAGKHRGEKEGYSRGENNTKIDIIKRRNNENISIDLISKIVFLDPSEVKNIISNNS